MRPHTLLAYKPMMVKLYPTARLLIPEINVRIPYDTIIKATCEHRHSIPNENCNCGLLFTRDKQLLRHWYDCQPQSGLFPIVMTFQLLGKILIEDSGVIKAEAAYKWGYIDPPYDVCSLFYSYLNWRHRLVPYANPERAHKEVVENWTSNELVFKWVNKEA